MLEAEYICSGALKTLDVCRAMFGSFFGARYQKCRPDAGADGTVRRYGCFVQWGLSLLRYLFKLDWLLWR
jgi:hypothetical protein